MTLILILLIGIVATILILRQISVELLDLTPFSKTMKMSFSDVLISKEVSTSGSDEKLFRLLTSRASLGTLRGNEEGEAQEESMSDSDSDSGSGKKRPKYSNQAFLTFKQYTEKNGERILYSSIEMSGFYEHMLKLAEDLAKESPNASIRIVRKIINDS